MSETIDVQMPDGTIIAGVPAGATREDVLARYRSLVRRQQRAAQYRTSDKLASNITLGLSDKVGALGDAIGGEIAEALGAPAAPFSQRYSDALAGLDMGEAAWNERNPAGRVLAAPLMAMGAPMAGAAPAFNALMAARQGAVAGGMAGAGLSRGSPWEQAQQAAFGSATGAVLAPAVGAAVNRLLQPGAQRLEDMARRQAILQAADAQGIGVLPADVGGRGVQRATRALEQSPVAAGAIMAAARRNVMSAEQAVERQAASMGRVLDEPGLGAAVQQGARDYLERSSAAGRRLYNRADQLAGAQKIEPRGALETLGDYLQTLERNPATNAGEIAAVKKVMGDLSQPGRTISDVRDVRTMLNAAYQSENLQVRPDQAFMRRVSQAITDDIERALANNPEGLQAYRAADRFWRERVATRDRALAQIIGKQGQLSSEQTAARIMRMADPKSGDAANLAGILRALPDDVRGDVASTIVSNLGRASGRSGNEFSPVVFSTTWRTRLSLPAKQALFPDPAHRAALDQIARVTEAMAASGRLANTSNTSSGTWMAANLGSGAIATAGVLTGNVAPVIVGALNVAGQAVGGRLLASPSFARWLVPTMRANNPQALAARLRALERLSAVNPAIQAEVATFQRALNDNIARLAADRGDSEQ